MMRISLPKVLPARARYRSFPSLEGDEPALAIAAESQHSRERVQGCGERGMTALRTGRRLLSISVHAFCEDPRTAEMLRTAAADRLLGKARVDVSTGGLDAAVAHYVEKKTPNLIVVETTRPRAQMLAGIARLAARGGQTTKTIVIGRDNDVALYRELLKFGISEYLVAPVRPEQFIESATNLFGHRGADPSGGIIAFIGAKGGVGSSTVCHNVAWTMSEMVKSDVVVVDLDLAFGTAGLNFDQEPTQGIAEALEASERLDEALLAGVLTRCSQHLSILAAPVALEPEYDISADACDALLDALRRYIPFVAVDLPHAWTPPVKHVLLQADEVVVTAAPDLASLRNARNLVDLLKPGRGGPPLHLVINMVGAPRRPDIAIKEFSAALDLDLAQVIEFDTEAFGRAANNGQMIEEFSRKAKAARQFRALALTLARGIQPTEAEKRSALGRLLDKLRRSI